MFTPLQNLEKPPLPNHFETVLYFLQRMDIEMLDTLLSAEHTYQGELKETFLPMLEEAFNRFREAGDEWLEIYSGQCGNVNCNYRCKGYRFNGNFSPFHLDLIIECQDDMVTDILTCHMFECTAAPFLPSAYRISLIPYSPILPEGFNKFW